MPATAKQKEDDPGEAGAKCNDRTHGGVVIGSEMTGGARNVFAENCTIDSPNLERAIRIKTNSIRGGLVENVYARNITIGQVRVAVLKINFY
jgi:polygalacturonase